MIRQHVAALLAYAVRLDPRSAPTDPTAAEETLDQWADILSDVPPTAPHPQGRDWNAAHAVRHHIATSPYPIKPSDVSRPWHEFKADIVGRHTNSFDPHAHPEIDPDDETGDAYLAALRAERQAVAAGQALPIAYKELTEGTTREERDRFAAKRLRNLGTYMPRTVAEQLAPLRRQRAERERLAAANQPDALDVKCPYEKCSAAAGQPCRQGKGNARTRELPHPSRLDLAAARLIAQEQPA
ncbi:zinc finger domain-containing protein [Streptomyces chryseus]